MRLRKHPERSLRRGCCLGEVTGLSGHREPTIRAEDNGLQSQWMRPAPSRNHTRSARTTMSARPWPEAASLCTSTPMERKHTCRRPACQAA